MLTINALRDYGADVEEGLGRCMNREDFYLRLVKMAMDEKAFLSLKDALEKKDLDAAFQAAHSLKGVLANLALTPMLIPCSEITEDLRAGKDIDYSPRLALLLARRDELLALIG